MFWSKNIIEDMGLTIKKLLVNIHLFKSMKNNNNKRCLINKVYLCQTMIKKLIMLLQLLMKQIALRGSLFINLFYY